MRRQIPTVSPVPAVHPHPVHALVRPLPHRPHPVHALVHPLPVHLRPVHPLLVHLHPEPPLPPAGFCHSLASCKP